MKGRFDFRKTRLAVSVPVFLLFFVLFLGEKDFTRILSQTLLLSQFVPSLIRFFSDPGHILSLGLVVILLITFIGCGGCEHACPTFPKSIKVTANSVHLKAEVYVPPELPVLDMDVKSDFPF